MAWIRIIRASLTLLVDRRSASVPGANLTSRFQPAAIVRSLPVHTTDRRHELLSELPLFPYLDIRVTSLATHPSAIPDPR
jgi:hypothetical protein